MEERLARRRQEIENMKNAKVKAEKLLASLGEGNKSSEGLENKPEMDGDDPRSIQRSQSKVLWQTIREELTS